MADQPSIVRGLQEVNTCTCGVPCYFKKVCSACQVGRLIDEFHHTTWDFNYVSMWASRLYRDVYQDVTILDVQLVPIRPALDEYGITVSFIDGSCTERWATYWHKLTKDEAQRLRSKLNESNDVTLNGFHWSCI